MVIIPYRVGDLGTHWMGGSGMAPCLCFVLRAWAKAQAGSTLGALCWIQGEVLADAWWSILSEFEANWEVPVDERRGYEIWDRRSRVRYLLGLIVQCVDLSLSTESLHLMSFKVEQERAQSWWADVRETKPMLCVMSTGTRRMAFTHLKCWEEPRESQAWKYLTRRHLRWSGSALSSVYNTWASPTVSCKYRNNQIHWGAFNRSLQDFIQSKEK